MRLAHIAMVRWHMFEIEDIPVEGDIGILGENRSGKSTILDLLQIILTGASPTYYRLNSPAGDNGGAKSKSQRTVRGYCLGQLGENDFKREGGLTYVSMSFVDPEGARPPVTIGLAIEASQGERAEIILGRFVATGVVLKTSDFLSDQGGAFYPLEWDAFRAGMVDRLGPQGFINHRERALDFVREYMRRLVPGISAGEKHASAMLKALVNAMTLSTDAFRAFRLALVGRNTVSATPPVRSFTPAFTSRATCMASSSTQQPLLSNAQELQEWRRTRHRSVR